MKYSDDKPPRHCRGAATEEFLWDNSVMMAFAILADIVWTGMEGFQGFVDSKLETKETL